MSGAPAGSRAGAALERRIRALANEVVDPCSVAQALPVGLVDMGMLLGVTVAPVDAPAGGCAVALRLRTTAPGCLYVVFFERELRVRIEALPGVASLAIEWDGAWDWTPDEMATEVRAALAERRRALLARTLPLAGSHRRVAPSPAV